MSCTKQTLHSMYYNKYNVWSLRMSVFFCLILQAFLLWSQGCVCFCLNVGALTSVTVGFIEFVHLKSPSVTYISLTINVIHKCQGSIMWNCWKYFACFYYFFPCSKLYPSAKWLIKAVMLCTRCTRILPWLEEFRHSVLIQHISLLNTMTSSSLVLLWKDSKYDIQWIIKSINNNNIKLPCNYLINRIVNLTCSF